MSLPSTGGLSLEAVLDAASRLIIEEGFEALSMRRLAARCGVTAMSLYRYVRTKEELLVVLANRLLGDLDVSAPGASTWQDEVAGVFKALHRMGLTHPEFIQIIAAQPVDGQVAFRWMEVVLGALTGAGLTNQQVAAGYDALASYTAGFNQQHTGRRAPIESAEQRARRMRELRADEFPHVVELADLLTNRNLEEHFDDGLMIVINGIASQVGNGSRKANCVSS